MNKKQFLILALTALSFITGGCLKSDGSSSSTSNCVPNNTGVPTAAEIASLQAYLSSKFITATQDSRGFFYVIHSQGGGPSPVLTSTVTVKYTGTLTDGTVFTQDISGNANFKLSDLILGWQMGLPLIQKSGSITLYLPPSLGYGCNQLSGVPQGSNLIFDIELTNVQ